MSSCHPVPLAFIECSSAVRSPHLSTSHPSNYNLMSTLSFLTQALPSFRIHRATPIRTCTMRYALPTLTLHLLFLCAASNNRSTPPLVTALSTVPNAQVAENIANYLVSHHLVACVNTLPGVKSTYWWQGKLNTDTELLLIMKTQEHLIDRVIEKVKELHPYQVPEVIVQPIINGYTPYLDWIVESTKNPS